MDDKDYIHRIEYIRSRPWEDRVADMELAKDSHLERAGRVHDDLSGLRASYREDGDSMKIISSKMKDLMAECTLCAVYSCIVDGSAGAPY